MLTYDSKRALIIVCVLIVLIILCVHHNYATVSNLISGFYNTNDAFNSAAGIDSFLVYIGTKSMFQSTRRGYIISTQGSSMIINQPIEFKITWDWGTLSNWFYILDHKTALNGSLRFKEKTPGIPQTIHILSYPSYGKIVLSDSKTIYATLYRNTEITEKISFKSKFECSDMTQKEKV